jgi:hypothetical protein
VWCQMWNLLSILTNDPRQYFQCLSCPWLWYQILEVTKSTTPI